MFDAVVSISQNPWVYYSYIVVYGLTVLVILGVIVSENRNPVRTLAWVCVLLLLPMVGIALYLFFGRSIKNKRMISRRDRRRLKRAERYRPVDAARLGLGCDTQQHIALARSLTGAVLYPARKVTIFTNGASKFAALASDIAAAKQYINLQYYIIEDDSVGERIARLLMERARAGVKVRVIYDHVGSLHTSNRFFRQMSQAGIETYPFFKVTFPPFGTRINWRNHRKLCVIDGTVGYVGGMNVAERYVDGGKNFDVWRDSHLRIEGPAVRALQYSFAVDWSFMGRPLPDADFPAPDPDDDTDATAGMQLLTSGPTSQWSNIEFMFQRIIASARRRIYIQTPYFLPTEGLLTALQTAAMSGVDVRLMLPRRSDSLMLTHASFSYVAECLRAGIKIYLYEKGMLHSKTILVDHETTSVGSSNFDFRSFEHNFEANMFVYSQDFNQRMADIFMADQRHSTRVIAANWRHRSRAAKVAESMLRLLAPIL